MSRLADDWVYQVFESLPGLPANRRQVLMVLAHCLNGESGQCNPSLNYLVKMTGLNRHTIPAALVDLERVGLITVHRRNGAGSFYMLHLDSLGNAEGLQPRRHRHLTGAVSSTGADSGTGAENSHTGAENSHEPVRFLAPEQGIEQGIEQVLCQGARKDAMDDPATTDPAPFRRGQLSALLRQQGVSITSAHPELCQWVNSDLTDEEAQEAIDRARLNKPAPAVIPAGYLVPIVRAVIGERHARVLPCTPTVIPHKPSISTLGGRHVKSQTRSAIFELATHAGHGAGGADIHDVFDGVSQPLEPCGLLN